MTRRAWTAHLHQVEVGATSLRVPRKGRAARVLPKPSFRQRLESMRESLAVIAAFDQAIPLCQVVECDPVPKPRMTQGDRHKKRPPVMRYRAYCDELRLAQIHLPHRFVFVAYIAMPDSWPEDVKSEFDGQPCLLKPDISNLAKALEDGSTLRDERLFDGRTIKRWARRGRVLVVNPAHPHDLEALVRQHQPSP